VNYETSSLDRENGKGNKNVGVKYNLSRRLGEFDTEVISHAVTGKGRHGPLTNTDTVSRIHPSGLKESPDTSYLIQSSAPDFPGRPAGGNC